MRTITFKNGKTLRVSTRVVNNIAENMIKHDGATKIEIFRNSEKDVYLMINVAEIQSIN